jgi:hypothetical protein
MGHTRLRRCKKLKWSKILATDVGKCVQVRSEEVEEIEESEDELHRGLMAWRGLQRYAKLLSSDRGLTREGIPDGSLLLECLASGLDTISEVMLTNGSINLSEEQRLSLGGLSGRVNQVAVESKSGTSVCLWKGVTDAARRVWVLMEFEELR